MELTLHNKQEEVFFCEKRFKLLIAGRRFGKSLLLLSSALYAALSYEGVINPISPPVVLIVMPTLKSCKAIHWEPLLRILEKAPFIKSINKTDYRIKLKGNKPDIILRGADNNGDRLRGLKIYYAAVDEVQDFPYKAWTEVIYPALSDTENSKALLIGTPKGKRHWIYDLSIKAKEDPSWGFFHYYTKDNPYIPREFLRQAKQSLPAKVYNQEFRASFEDFDGQIFTEIKEKHIVKEVPNNLSYYIGIDWGDTNPAFSVIGLDNKTNNFYIVDSWYNNSQTPITQEELFDKLKEYCQRYKVYRCYMPDDRPASIIAARKYGLIKEIDGLKRAVKVSRNSIKVMEGCDIINSLFYQDKLYIKRNNEQLIEEYKNYHRAIDKDGNLINKPSDNKSHILDSSRYCITTIKGKLI